MGPGRARLSDPAAPKQAAAELREAKDEIRELKDVVAKLAATRVPVQAPAPAQAAASARANGAPSQPPYPGSATAPGSSLTGYANGLAPPPAWGGPRSVEGAPTTAGRGAGAPGMDGEPAVHGAAAAAGMGVLPGAGPPLGEPPHPNSYMKVRSFSYMKRLTQWATIPGAAWRRGSGRPERADRRVAAAGRVAKPLKR